MPAEDLVELELMLNRFRKLVGEMMRGGFTRTTFQPWEVEILVDIEECPEDAKRRPDVLKQYLKAVEKQMEMGPGPPMKLSQFLQLKMTRRPANE